MPRCETACYLLIAKATEAGFSILTVPAWQIDGTMEHAQRAALLIALRECKGNIAKTADYLQIGRSTVYRLMKRYAPLPISKASADLPTAARTIARIGEATPQGMENSIVFDGQNYVMIRRK